MGAPTVAGVRDLVWVMGAAAFHRLGGGGPGVAMRPYGLFLWGAGAPSSMFGGVLNAGGAVLGLFSPFCCISSVLVNGSADGVLCGHWVFGGE